VSESALIPESIDELQRIISHRSQVIAVGNQTKPPLSRGDGATLVSLSGLHGIVQYEPSEFTFTALAGTPLKVIVAALAEQKQYLPFDPLLVEAGATIGGTVAAGLSGPGRFRYGSVRDFILGVDFLNGDGKLIRSGGKVVKNAAGFDLPKFLVGSLGRLGVMVSLTFKVFPAPPALTTLQVSIENHADALRRISRAASSYWELDAIDYRLDDQKVYLRIGGPKAANLAIAAQIKSTWGSDVTELEDADAWWRSINEMSWHEQATGIVKIPVTPNSAPELFDRLPGRLHASAAVNVVWQALDSAEQVSETDAVLKEYELPGLVIRGDIGDPCIGHWPKAGIHTALKAALDTVGRFPPLCPATA